MKLQFIDFTKNAITRFSQYGNNEILVTKHNIGDDSKRKNEIKTTKQIINLDKQERRNTEAAALGIRQLNK